MLKWCTIDCRLKRFFLPAESLLINPQGFFHAFAFGDVVVRAGEQMTAAASNARDTDLETPADCGEREFPPLRLTCLYHPFEMFKPFLFQVGNNFADALVDNVQVG